MLEKLDQDMHTYLRNQDKFNLSVMRMLKSVIQLETIAKKDKLTDDEVIAIIKKQVKIRKESMLEYEKYSKTDTVNELKKEIDLLSKYLPEELSSDEVNKIVDEVINSSQDKNIGLIMKSLAEKIGSQADMRLVSNLVREKLK